VMASRREAVRRGRMVDMEGGNRKLETGGWKLETG
jgi:hypothetical protein